MGSKPVIEIDGAGFSTLDEFYDEISRKVIRGAYWGRNLDGFNDILRGGFGTPEGGFVLRWVNSGLSRERLGYAETVRVLERRLEKCHESWRSSICERIAAAQADVGQTIFEELVEIIEKHCAGGDEAEDGVELVLA